MSQMEFGMEGLLMKVESRPSLWSRGWEWYFPARVFECSNLTIEGGKWSKVKRTQVKSKSHFINALLARLLTISCGYMLNCALPTLAQVVDSVGRYSIQPCWLCQLLWHKFIKLWWPSINKNILKQLWATSYMNEITVGLALVCACKLLRHQ